MANEQKLIAPRIIELLYYFRIYEQDYSLSLSKYLLQFPIPAVNRWFDPTVIDGFARFAERLPYRRIIHDLFKIMLDDCDPEESFAYSNQAVQEIYESLKPAVKKHHKPLSKEELLTNVSNSYYRANDSVTFPDVVKAKEISFWLDNLKNVYLMNGRDCQLPVGIFTHM